MTIKLIDFFNKLLRLGGLSTGRQKRGDIAMPESRPQEALVEIGTRTYDALPKIAQAFLEYAVNANVTKDLSLSSHRTFTFQPETTITFSYCNPDPKYSSSRAINFKSRERDFFQLWFEVRGVASLNYGQPREMREIYSQGKKIKGDVKAFIEAAEFVLNLSPQAFGVPLKVE